MKRYNTDNLKPFTSQNASYYGRNGGVASGKSKLEKKIRITRYNITMLYLDIEPYRTRKRIYKKELEYVKKQIHHIKIYNNRLNKLIDKYNKKYGVIA